MKQVVRVDTLLDESDADRNPNWEADLHSILDPFGPIEIQTFPNPLARTFIFDHYPEKLDAVWESLSPLGFYGSIGENREYSQEELLQAEFVMLDTEAVINSIAGTLRWQKIPLCPFCGFQETKWDFGPLRIAEKPQDFQIARVDWHPLVMSSSLAHRMKIEAFSGIDLIPILGDRAPSWYAIHMTRKLPRCQSLRLARDGSLGQHPTAVWITIVIIQNLSCFIGRRGFIVVILARHMSYLEILYRQVAPQ